MLFERDSTNKHLNATRRHIRFVRKIKTGETLAAAIEPHYNNLIAKKEERLAKVTLREDANDDLSYADSVLDNAVRNAFSACEKYDREYPDNRALRTVFPDGKFGDLIKLPIQEEPDEVDNVVLRFQSLGEDHPLFIEAETLASVVTNSKTAISALRAAIKAVKIAEAEEEMAQANLRRQYENNYLQARSTFGRSVAERIFPKLSGGSAKTAPVEEENVE